MIKRFNEFTEKDIKKLKELINDKFFSLDYIDTDKLYLFKNNNNTIYFSLNNSEFGIGTTVSIITYQDNYFDELVTALEEKYEFLFFIIDYYNQFDNKKLLKVDNIIDKHKINLFKKYYCNKKELVDVPLNYLVKKHIPELDFNKLKFYDFNRDQLLRFNQTNYLYNNEILGWKTPSNFYYLFGFCYTKPEIPEHNCSFLLCTLDNAFGKETIVGVLKYNLQYNPERMEDGITFNYISYAETNYFYRNKGIYKLLIEKFINEINNNNIIISNESDMGKIVGTQRIIFDIASKNNISFEIIKQSELLNYFESKLKLDK